MQRILLLNGASHGDTLNEVVHAYRHDATPDGGIDGCIVAPDEATHLGSVLDVGDPALRLPVGYASTGQRVPEHLEPRQRRVAGRARIPDAAPALSFAERGSVRTAPCPRRTMATPPARPAPAGADGICAADRQRQRGGAIACGSRTLALQLRAGPLAPGSSAPRARLRCAWMAQQVREAACRDLSRHCDRFVLSLSATVAAPVAGAARRALATHALAG
ncbi:hypothetical protein ACU4GD_04350 [Cupriavidus basilensis]